MDIKRNKSKEDSLDSLFASSDDKEIKQNTQKSVKVTPKNNKEILPKNKNQINNETKKEPNITNKRKINDVLKSDVESSSRKSWYDFTSKYAYEFEHDAKKAKKEKIVKKGKYMFLYKHGGKRDDYVSLIPDSNDKSNVKKKKKDRDPNLPKKFKTAFFQFMHEERDKAKKKFTEIKSNKELMQKLGETWKNMGEDKKKKYVEMGKKDKEKYDIAMKEYKSKQ